MWDEKEKAFRTKKVFDTKGLIRRIVETTANIHTTLERSKSHHGHSMLFIPLLLFFSLPGWKTVSQEEMVPGFFQPGKFRPDLILGSEQSPGNEA
jgi:hypothetical protein